MPCLAGQETVKVGRSRASKIAPYLFHLLIRPVTGAVFRGNKEIYLVFDFIIWQRRLNWMIRSLPVLSHIHELLSGNVEDGKLCLTT